MRKAVKLLLLLFALHYHPLRYSYKRACLHRKIGIENVESQKDLTISKLI